MIKGVFYPIKVFSKKLLQDSNKVYSQIPPSKTKVIKDAENFWSSSNKNSEIQDLSHWCGKGRWVNSSSWKSIGLTHFSMYEQILRITGKTDQVHSMVEWGPGGGANLIAFSKEIEVCYGVDISLPNLEECERQLKSVGYNGFKKILISAENPEDCPHQIKSKVDFFLSTAVYQHFPSKEYGIKVTELAYELLSNNGIALIQIRYEDGSTKIVSKKENYSKNAITFTSYTIEEFWIIASKVGFKLISLYLQPETNYAYYFLEKVDRNV